ncbi:hypothetical protein [Cellulomonas massiliensis]|uniref:hypothetical protein n=1 Tax=Cellulomonas massiliensis TaxID=1465811 RepID=UPI0002F59C38|nr:hypothetical protein [Cellulomonas massiliensis]
MTSPTAWQPAPEDRLDLHAGPPAPDAAWTPPPGRLGGAEVDPFAGLRRDAVEPGHAVDAAGPVPADAPGARGRLARAWSSLTSDDRPTWSSVSRVVGVGALVRQLVAALAGVLLVGLGGFLLGIDRLWGLVPLLAGVALVVLGLRRTSRFLDALPR